MDRLTLKLGEVAGVIGVCTTDLATLFSKAMFLKDEALKTEDSDWANQTIEGYIAQLSELKMKLNQAEEALSRALPSKNPV